MYVIGQKGVSVPLPARFRNANSTRACFQWSILALLFLVPLLFVPLVYKWFFGALFVVTGAFSVYYFVARQHVDLVVSEDGLTLGGVRRSRQIGWGEIAKFQIWIRSVELRSCSRSPHGGIRGQAVLLDGSTIRLRAIEPWHGFTALTYLAVRRLTSADRTVQSLDTLA
jgi:hypothetical protein